MLFTSTYGVSTHDFWNLELRHHHDVDTNVFILLFLLIVCYYQKRGVSFFLTKRFSFVLHFLLQKYSFSFKLQTFCREILGFNTILSSSASFFSTFVSRFLHYTLLYIGRKKKKKLFRRNVINFPTRRYLFREQVTERGKLILKTCPF
jgi:hypothetical protein